MDELGGIIALFIMFAALIHSIYDVSTNYYHSRNDDTGQKNLQKRVGKRLQELSDKSVLERNKREQEQADKAETASVQPQFKSDDDDPWVAFMRRKNKKLEELRNAYTELENAVPQMLADFEASRMHELPSGSHRSMVSAETITINEESGTTWVKIRDGKTTIYKTTFSHTEYSGYHDEDNYYYNTNIIESLEGWDNENWFDSEQWIQKTAKQSGLPMEFSLDALYYEGIGNVRTTRWMRRDWMQDESKGSLMIYLRRCKDCYRMLRISRRDIHRLEFNFTESAIEDLYRQYGDNCCLFEDFMLTEDECSYLEKSLQSMKHQRIYCYEQESRIGFILKKGNDHAEESVLPESILSELMSIRSLEDEDYWERKDKAV